MSLIFIIFSRGINDNNNESNIIINRDADSTNIKFKDKNEDIELKEFILK